MTKADLVYKVSLQTGIDTIVVKAVIDSTIANIKSILIDGGTLYLRGFGTFLNKIRKTKTARNIKNNTPLIIPEHITPYFKPGKNFINQFK